MQTPCSKKNSVATTGRKTSQASRQPNASRADVGGFFGCFRGSSAPCLRYTKVSITEASMADANASSGANAKPAATPSVAPAVRDDENKLSASTFHPPPPASGPSNRSSSPLRGERCCRLGGQTESVTRVFLNSRLRPSKRHAERPHLNLNGNLKEVCLGGGHPTRSAAPLFRISPAANLPSPRFGFPPRRNGSMPVKMISRPI